MDANGRVTNERHVRVLNWPGRVLTASDVRRALNGHRQVRVPRQTIVTPLAAEELRANGILVTREEPQEQQAAPRTWGHAQQRPYPMVHSAVQAARREGARVTEWPVASGGTLAGWARALAECVARGDCCGGVIFCDDPGLVCCVANKVGGLRAVPVVTVAQAARATLTLGANLLAVEMPGRTFFEIRQILRILCCPAGAACPPGVACTLEELDGHAHR
jgi:ribose 5-phosphate isomerase RpiB